MEHQIFDIVMRLYQDKLRNILTELKPIMADPKHCCTYKVHYYYHNNMPNYYYDIQYDFDLNAPIAKQYNKLIHMKVEILRKMHDLYKTFYLLNDNDNENEYEYSSKCREQWIQPIYKELNWIHCQYCGH